MLKKLELITKPIKFSVHQIFMITEKIKQPKGAVFYLNKFEIKGYICHNILLTSITINLPSHLYDSSDS